MRDWSLMPPARRPLRPVIAGIAGLALGLVGCGGDDAGATDEARTGLRDALGFLATDFDLTDGEIGCIGRTLDDRLDGADLDAFADGLRRVDEGTAAITDLSPEDEALLTSAIAECVAAS